MRRGVRSTEDDVMVVVVGRGLVGWRCGYHISPLPQFVVRDSVQSTSLGHVRVHSSVNFIHYFLIPHFNALTLWRGVHPIHVPRYFPTNSHCLCSFSLLNCPTIHPGIFLQFLFFDFFFVISQDLTLYCWQAPDPKIYVYAFEPVQLGASPVGEL